MTVFRDDLVVLLPELRAVARSLTRGDVHWPTTWCRTPC